MDVFSANISYFEGLSFCCLVVSSALIAGEFGASYYFFMILTGGSKRELAAFYVKACSASFSSSFILSSFLLKFLCMLLGSTLISFSFLKKPAHHSHSGCY